MIKNLETLNLLQGLIISILYEVYRLLFFIKDKDWKAIKAVGEGFYQFFNELPTSIKLRKAIQKTRTISDSELYSLSIICPLDEAIKEYRKLGT